MKFARLAEINLFTTLSFVLLMEIDLDGEPLSYDFYDMALVVMTISTSCVPIAIVICVSLAKIFRLYADSDPTINTGDVVKVTYARGPEQAKCLHCTGNVVGDVPERCTSNTLIQVEVAPRLISLRCKRPVCRRAELAVRTCQRWFCCFCVEGRLQVGSQVLKPVVLELERSQIRKIVSKRKVALELCKVCVNSMRLVREADRHGETDSLEDSKAKIANAHSSGMIEGKVSNAAFANVLVGKLKPILEPVLNERGLLWEPCLPYIKKVC